MPIEKRKSRKGFLTYSVLFFQILFLGVFLPATQAQQRLFSAPGTASLKGLVRDTSDNRNLQQAVVSVLRYSDSVLVAYTRTNESGVFVLKNLPEGPHVLMVTYPAFTDFSDRVDLVAGKETDWGQISVIPTIKLLEEVIVRQRRSPVRVNGDTIEYLADSFKVAANANVQDLLKRMPGMSVNSKGEIVANGTRVERVLVDGEEFFSDDPAVVTKNLRADMVDKVQEFDMKSEQATFSGIDDGERTKTLNLVLKEDKKRGYFGALEAGAGWNDYRYGKALFNSFKGKRKLAAYVTGDNTKYETLNWDERRKYGEDLNSITQMTDDGGIMITSSGDEFSWGEGLPRSYTAGLHYNNKWNKDKYSNTTTYQFNDLMVEGRRTDFQQTLLPDGSSQISSSTNNYEQNNRRHRLRAVYDWNIDSSSSLKLTANGSLITRSSNSFFQGDTKREDGTELNRTDRRLTNEATDENFNINVFYRKKFKKEGRTLSWLTNLEQKRMEAEGFLFADNRFFTGGIPNQEIDQLKLDDQKIQDFNSKLSVTERLSKKYALEISSQLQVTGNNSRMQTLEGGVAGSGRYDELVDSLSNDFVFNTRGWVNGVKLRYKFNKLSWTVGGSAGNVVFDLRDRETGAKREERFFNVLPSASINYEFKKQTSLDLTYNGTPRNPSLQQINPIINNIDPLNLYIGNENLKQEFTHAFGLRFNSFKMLKRRGIFLNANFRSTQNAITNSSEIDPETGGRVSQAVNVNGNYNFSFWSNYRFELFPSFSLGFGLTPYVSRFNNIVNGRLNENNNQSLRFSINTGYWGEKKLNYWFDFGPAYNRSKNTINPQAIAYWSYTSYFGLEYKLPKKWYLTLDGDANIFQQTDVFANQRNVILLNGNIRKSIDKAEKWQLKLSVNDMFNQNQYINRSISSNFISETANIGIRRFALLSVIFNFKNPAPKASPAP